MQHKLIALVTAFMLLTIEIEGNDCVLPTDDVHVDMKNISMYSLITDGNKYDKNMVSIQGVLHVGVDGQPRLFLNQEALNNTSLLDSVKLEFDPVTYVRIFEKLAEDTDTHFDVHGTYNHLGWKINGRIKDITFLCKSTTLEDFKKYYGNKYEGQRREQYKQWKAAIVDSIEYIGNVTEEAKSDISDAFEGGLAVTENGAVTSVLPGFIKHTIYKIEFDNGAFTIYHSKFESGYKQIHAKYVCPKNECRLIFYDNMTIVR